MRVDWHREVQLLDGRQSQLVEQHRSDPAVGAGEGHEIGVDPLPIKEARKGMHLLQGRRRDVFIPFDTESPS